MFERILGQASVKAKLGRALEMRNITNAYLLTGPEGVGKRMIAEDFAENLLGKAKTTMYKYTRRMIDMKDIILYIKIISPRFFSSPQRFWHTCCTRCKNAKLCF